MTTPKLREATVPATDQSAADIASALRTFDAEGEGISALAEALRGDLKEPFCAAVGLMREAKGRIIVTGVGKSGHIARKIASTLASTGTPAFFVHAAEASHGDLGMITPDDVIIALSWSGETSELKDLVTYSRRFRIGLISVTAGGDSSLAKASDIVLTLPRAREACPNNLAPTTSSVMQLALGDALAIALLEGRGFTSLDFGVFHPGGKLGAMLRYVRDLMHTGAAVPLKPLGTAMSDALVEMSSKGFGCVGIVDGDGMLAGIVTDGDLRRHMRPDLMTIAVDDVMTQNPKTVSAGTLASEVLEILNSSKITAMVVTDQGRPVGIIHMHDILRAGVV
ncbi:MAG TPA: KpsF/GutQ family sugar-phosphate isomerase [Xanthobacteraceae bacterium]|nr:KpsF/GutQ family sugar-phosphate isomerase [Xanthobacteraceae bacterium]